jgi:hypothetical protein
MDDTLHNTHYATKANLPGTGSGRQKAPCPSGLQAPGWSTPKRCIQTSGNAFAPKENECGAPVQSRA